MAHNYDAYIKWFSELEMNDTDQVGGKNASLGEMIKNLKQEGVRVPDGFATTSYGYEEFIRVNKLEQKITGYLEQFHSDEISLQETGQKIRQEILKHTFPTAFAESIGKAYAELSEKYDRSEVDVAVRSSATAEDLPSASFAGQQETYLNIRGKDELLRACRDCFASLFTNRAISYREKKGFDHMKVQLSVGVQKMVRADDSCSGVMFTVDTESGFPDVVLINGSWGLGENIVKGTVNPDQFFVFKPLLDNPDYKPIIEKKTGSKEVKMIYSSDEGNNTKNIPTTVVERQTLVLNDEEILKLAKWGAVIERHYDKAMDIEWVKDDETDDLFIVQARPETVHSQNQNGVFKTFSLKEKNPKLLVSGLSIGSSIVSGVVKIVKKTSDLSDLQSNHILVTEMTEPDWVSEMKNAAGIVTDFGGRTCHAAIVSRELGIPAVVGTSKATDELKDGDKITISCAEGETGKVYEGELEYKVDEIELEKVGSPKTNIMLNIATPESAFKWWKMPVKGVGLARMEFIITNHIKIHPMALVHPDRIKDEDEYKKIRKLTMGHEDFKEYFIDKLACGIAKIASSQYPNPVIVRTSDFKTNEYAGLIGGSYFEPAEENPMLGWRGASRYYSDDYRDGFELECKALKKVREIIGLDNVIVMIPFCRTLNEAENVIEVMAKFGLKRGEKGLKVYMMCEIPSNVILAEEFAENFDGFSIGSNDLTQLILGVDRDSAKLSYLFDENDKAVKTAIREVIEKAKRANVNIGFCGQAPSDNSDYAAFLVDCGIDSISVIPDSVINVLNTVNEAERKVMSGQEA